SEGPFSRREEGWELGEEKRAKKSNRKEKSPSSDVWMGLRALIKVMADIQGNRLMVAVFRIHLK
ncbi:MAG: hypothetical protein WCJ06_16770, partial [Planctomycetota bacterium]